MSYFRIFPQEIINQFFILKILEIFSNQKMSIFYSFFFKDQVLSVGSICFDKIKFLIFIMWHNLKINKISII